MKNYTSPDINLISITTDIITTSVEDHLGEPDTPTVEFNW